MGGSTATGGVRASGGRTGAGGAAVDRGGTGGRDASRGGAARNAGGGGNGSAFADGGTGGNAGATGSNPPEANVDVNLARDLGPEPDAGGVTDLPLIADATSGACPEGWTLVWSDEFEGQAGALADDFHVFAIEWEADAIRWYVDGTLYSTKTSKDIGSGNTWVYDKPHFILLNLAVGGNWPGAPGATTVFPQTMVVDHVRVCQR